MKKLMGVFTYDCYPGMVVHNILGWKDNGSVEFCKGYCLKAEALIAVFPKKQGEEIKQCLQILKQKEREQVDKIQKELLEAFFEKYPMLKTKSD